MFQWNCLLFCSPSHSHSLSMCYSLGSLQSSLFSFLEEHQPNCTMPLEEGKGWKKKTTDIKENYDFKEVLGTWVFLEINHFKLAYNFKWVLVKWFCFKPSASWSLQFGLWVRIWNTVCQITIKQVMLFMVESVNRAHKRCMHGWVMQQCKAKSKHRFLVCVIFCICWNNLLSFCIMGQVGNLLIMSSEAEACSQHTGSSQMTRHILTILLNTAPALSHCGYFYTAMCVGEYLFSVTFTLHPHSILVCAWGRWRHKKTMCAYEHACAYMCVSTHVSMWVLVVFPPYYRYICTKNVPK